MEAKMAPEGADQHPLKYVELPAAKFPVSLEALHPDTGVVVWSAVITAPADMTLVRIPALKHQLGHPVVIRITYGDGTVQQQMPPAGNV